MMYSIFHFSAVLQKYILVNKICKELYYETTNSAAMWKVACWNGNKGMCSKITFILLCGILNTWDLWSVVWWMMSCYVKDWSLRFRRVNIKLIVLKCTLLWLWVQYLIEIMNSCRTVKKVKGKKWRYMEDK